MTTAQAEGVCWRISVSCPIIRLPPSCYHVILMYIITSFHIFQHLRRGIIIHRKSSSVPRLRCWKVKAQSSVIARFRICHAPMMPWSDDVVVRCCWDRMLLGPDVVGADVQIPKPHFNPHSSSIFFHQHPPLLSPPTPSLSSTTSKSSSFACLITGTSLLSLYTKLSPSRCMSAFN